MIHVKWCCRAEGGPGGSDPRNSSEQHPFHLHGHHFWVLASGDGPYNSSVEAMYNLVNPMYRDTQIVPKGGWSVIRFVVRPCIVLVYLGLGKYHDSHYPVASSTGETVSSTCAICCGTCTKP